MLYRVFILEDEEKHAQRLISLLNAYQESHPDVRLEVTHFSNSFRLRAEYNCNADLLFMDIQMEGMNGIQTAREIRKTDPKVMIIFTTSLAQYAIEGYSVQAFDFILKPLEERVFEAKLDIALHVLAHTHTEDWIDVSNKTETKRITVSDITFIEVASHNVLIHTKQSIISCWGSLRDFEEKLSGMHFARCNACYLVNLRNVHSISGNTVAVGNDVLAISKAKHREFLTTFAMYKGGST